MVKDVKSIRYTSEVKWVSATFQLFVGKMEYYKLNNGPLQQKNILF